MDLVDENGYNLIHSSAYHNSNKITEFLLKFLKDNLKKHYRKQRGNLRDGPSDEPDLTAEESVKIDIKAFLNMRTKGEEGFIALHFASYHGNAKML